MTMVEMLVAVGIGSLVTIALASLIIYTARGFGSLSNYVDMDKQSRNALDVMSREIRSATGPRSATTNEIRFDTPAGTNSLRYFYNARDRVFTQFKSGTRTPLLTGCDEMMITIYGRNNVSNQFSQFVTTNVGGAKMVQFTWTCSRTIIGARLNTESVQSAKIVIRKQN